MKKGLCLLLSVFMVAVSLCSCSMIKDDGVLTEQTYVDAQGNTHQYATDANGVVITEKGGAKVTTTTTTKASGQSGEAPGQAIYATDANGENITDANGNLVTTKIDYEALFSEANKTTTTTKKKPNVSGPVDINDAVGGAGKEDLLPSGDKTNKTNLKTKYVDPIVKTKKYTLQVRSKMNGMDIPMTLCVNGNDYAAKLSIPFNAMPVEARIFTKNGKYYAVIPMFGIYSEVDDETSSDATNTTDKIESEATYVKSTKVKDGSVTYTCEEYKSKKDGTVVKYYFNSKNEWKRWECVDGDSVTVFEVEKFSGTVDSALFKEPSNLTIGKLPGLK